MTSPPAVAVFGSPRREGNTARLLREAVAGARESGLEVREVFLRDLRMSPCLELYGCRAEGRCVIEDDFGPLARELAGARAILLASPIFFYTVSAQVKILMDRCQSLWVKKYWIEKAPFGRKDPSKRGLFVSAGASTGERLFDGAVLSVRYFLDVFDMPLWKTLLYRGLDLEGDVLAHPEYLEEARAAGRALAAELA
ncbi:flavodoxin family protein [Dissulfurirhabdus thermomarina]|uniref:Flavodoxin family protein n=1 Tax=Dissulfurirhabdus thermomarina TaxID=1765737 RepID=A0A6N9TWY4_DISTH|nr:flavodoxin family protein [Dissulfurirhabdus thermomarina]NDY42986.1 flavodoxin family protein [Dissulfurirhabdus thermomarina]NMX22722.1 flavodoxin family protein [Dissulfurirhabdus thermomarina]